jgi:hypothetical protein
MRKELALIMKYFVLCIALLAFILIPTSNVRADSDDRWYAGYNNTYDPPQGVKGKIYTIQKNIPWNIQCNHFLAEWVGARLNILPKYWIQTGYIGRWWPIIPPFWYAIYTDFYIESWDSSGRYFAYLLWLKPIIGHTYTYSVQNGIDIDFHYWGWTVKEGASTIWSGTKWLDPWYPIYTEARVETTSTSIKIDGSHFSDLRYYNYPPSSWPLWQDHNSWPYPPYTTTYVSDYEFYASGGG